DLASTIRLAFEVFWLLALDSLRQKFFQLNRYHLRSVSAGIFSLGVTEECSNRNRLGGFRIRNVTIKSPALARCTGRTFWAEIPFPNLVLIIRIALHRLI